MEQAVMVYFDCRHFSSINLNHYTCFNININSLSILFKLFYLMDEVSDPHMVNNKIINIVDFDV